MRFICMQRKDVINLKTGGKIGYISDIEIDPVCKTIQALIVEKFSLFKLICFFKGPPCIIIPVDRIINIGEDVILVDIDCEETII